MYSFVTCSRCCRGSTSRSTTSRAARPCTTSSTRSRSRPSRRAVSVFVVNCGSSSLKWSVVDAASGETLGSGTVQKVTDHAVGAWRGARGRAAGRRRGRRAPRRPRRRALLGAGADQRRRAGRDPRPRRARAAAQPGQRGRHRGRAARASRTLPHVAVFDTAFHATLPPRAFTYAVPRAWGVRRYGFHGTSHAYVSREAARAARPPRRRDVIVLHLGNGASAQRGRRRALDRHLDGPDAAGGAGHGHALRRRRPRARAARAAHAQPVDGGDRRGPELALAACSRSRATTTCARSSGASRAGDAAAELALDVYCYRIRKYVGAYLAALGGADAIAFTAGVGENDAARPRALARRAGAARDRGRRRRATRRARPSSRPTARRSPCS